MLKNPLIWLGGLSSLVLAVSELGESPVLNRSSMVLAWTMAPMAVATAIVAGHGVLRARGRTDAHPTVVMPLGMADRVTGIAVGLVWPTAATFLLQLGLLGWLFARDPVTSVVWTELLVGPAYVLLAGSVAAALTRLFPHPSTPVLSLVILALPQLVVSYDPGRWGLTIGPAALAPIFWPETIIPYELAFRPSGLHLAYLVGLATMAVGSATLGRNAAWGLLVVGLATAIIAGPTQLGPIPDQRRVEAISQMVGDGADLTCRQDDMGVNYCAMAGYEAWIDDWQDFARPILSVAPPAAVAGIEVRQYPVHNVFLLTEGDYGQWWWMDLAQSDFASRDVVPVGSMLHPDYSLSESTHFLTARIVGCPLLGECPGEGQRVTQLWLALHDRRVASYTVEDPSWGSEYAQVAECMLIQAWDRPGLEELIRSNWGTLTDPNTTYQQTGKILGVDVPKGWGEGGVLTQGCP